MKYPLLLVVSTFVAAVLTSAVPAVAQPRRIGPPSLQRETAPAPSVIEEATRWFVAATQGPVTAAPVEPASGATAERAATAPPSRPFFDLAPRLAIVARDWRGSMKLAGSGTTLVDELRPTASNRMVLTRLSTGGRLTTFAQLGAGQWRIDTAMFPSARAYDEIAGQVGAGFEIAVASQLRVAGESQYTFLFRNLRYTGEEVAPRITSFVLAVKGQF